MPTLEQIARIKQLEPEIIACFGELGTVLGVAKRLRVSQCAVRRVLAAAGLSTPKRGLVAFGWKGDAAGDAAGVAAGRVRARNRYPLSLCERCNKAASDRHHVDGNTLNNTTENVMILCRRCHMLVDGRLEQFRTMPRTGKQSQGTLCKICGDTYRPLRRGRCLKCASYFYLHGIERPASPREVIHCPRGHAYTPENTRIDKKGCKNCRACRREDARRYRRLAKAIIAGETEDPRGN